MEDVVAGIINWFIGFMININGVSAAQLEIKMDGTMAGTMITGIWNFLAPFAVTLTVVYFGIDLNKRMVFEGTDVTLKTFGFPFIRLAAALVVIDHGLDIFKALTDITNGLVSGVESVVQEADYSSLLDGELGKRVAQVLGFWGLIAFLLPMLISIIVGLICNLLWWYKAFTFKCEFVGRYMLGPIALADVYSGANAAAIRYLKGMLAFGLYGVCLVILPKVVMAVALTDITDAFTKLATVSEGIGGAFDAMGTLLMVVVAPIAAVGIVGAAKSFTREAVGA